MNLAKNQIPKIIGYFDLEYNCLYSAIDTSEETLIKHMLISKNPKLHEKVSHRVEMTVNGYSIERGIVKDPLYTVYTKDTSRSKSSVKHWSLNWFRADYMRWSTLAKHNKKQARNILAEDLDRKPLPQPTTKQITRVTLSKLLAGHVCNAYCTDMEAKSEKMSLEELLTMYIEETGIKKKHGNRIHSLTMELIEKINPDSFATKIKEPDFVFGTDTFIKML